MVQQGVVLRSFHFIWWLTVRPRDDLCLFFNGKEVRSSNFFRSGALFFKFRYLLFTAMMKILHIVTPSFHCLLNNHSLAWCCESLVSR